MSASSKMNGSIASHATHHDMQMDALQTVHTHAVTRYIHDMSRVVAGWSIAVFFMFALCGTGLGFVSMLPCTCIALVIAAQKTRQESTKVYWNIRGNGSMTLSDCLDVIKRRSGAGTPLTHAELSSYMHLQWADFIATVISENHAPAPPSDEVKHAKSNCSH